MYPDEIHQSVVEQTERRIPSTCLWYGKHVKVVDGSSVSMPDTEENQQLYPQPSGQKKGCGFPVMRIVAMFSLVTGVILACRKGSLHIHERTLWHDMWDCYQKDDVVLADCGFCSFADYYLLKEKGIDPYRISFKGAIASIIQWTPLLANIADINEKRQCIDALMQVIAADLLFQLLTKPRHEFTEIPHRHKCKKNA